MKESSMRYANNSSIAHAWAHQNNTEGKTPNGNFSFKGKVIYSYRTGIGLLITGTEGQPTSYLYATTRYSATTSSKHMPELHSAASHLAGIPVQEIPDDGIVTANWAITELRKRMSDRQSILTNFERARIKDMKRFWIDSYRRWEEQSNLLIGILNYQKMVGIETRLASYQETVKSLMGSYLTDNELELMEQQAETAKTRESRPTPRDLSREEKLEAWKKFKRKTLVGCYYQTTHLRLNNKKGDVETSKGIRIPEKEAYYAYIQFRKGRLLGHKLAGYTITQVDNERRLVVAGCHSVPFEEIEEIGAKLCEKFKQSKSKSKSTGLNSSLN